MINESLDLEAYVLNLLDEDEVHLLETRLANSPELQQELIEVQDAYNLLASAENTPSVGNELYARIVQSVSGDNNTRVLEQCMKLFDLPREPMEALFALLQNTKQDAWQPTPIPGTQIHYFSGGPAAAQLTCGMMIVKPSVVFPAHKHKGKESIVVIQGSIVDNLGNSYRAGDFIESSTGSWHSFQVNSTENFVFAVALEKPHRWLILRTLLDMLFSKYRFNKH